MESIEEFRSGLGLERVALVMHDWGGLIGLWWACEHPEAVTALVISASGFFPDGKWHGVAQAARTPGTGEEMVEGMTRDGLEALLKQNGSGFDDESIDEYWKCFGDDAAARATSTSGARPTSRSSSASTASSPRWACRPCCCGARPTRSRSSRAPIASSATSPAPSSSRWRAPATS